MNSIFVDPDIKVNMSLDEIIRLTKDELNGQLQGKGFKHRRKRKNNARSNENFSEPFLPSASEVGSNVGVNNSVHDMEQRKRFIQEVSNRGFNSELLQKSKEIIPAEYKLIKTSSGVERVLVPVSDYYTKPQKQRLRRLNKSPQNLNFVCGNTLDDKPPPLMSAFIFDPPIQSKTCMDVAGSDDDIKELCVSKKKKNLQVIDLENDLPLDVIEAKKMCVAPQSALQNGAEMKTLSDRFTMLTGNFQF